MCTPPGDGSPSPAPPPSLTIPADVHPSLGVDTPARARSVRTRTLDDTSYTYAHTASHPTDVASYKARRPGLQHRAAQHGTSPSRLLHHPGPACAVRDRQPAETTSSRGLSAPQHTLTRVRNPAAGHRALIWPNISSGVWFLKVVGFASHLLKREHLRTRKEKRQQANVQSHPLAPLLHLPLHAADIISPPATSPPSHPSPTLTCIFS